MNRNERNAPAVAGISQFFTEKRHQIGFQCIWREIQVPSGFVFEELAECLLIKNSRYEAKEYFRKAYEILSKDIWLKANAVDRLQRLHKLGG